ncbi:MAG: DNA replication/repair protein RecF [endosymbiont of Galathealinum brachiosum]|uniref:DNA replication and repair protein RecF n=1 Tax=endosymbiont of Galathealinum brachiosum TaxID=2200906 RepID=A0A370DCP5_9GAMM|nr:MAG: DNA replication/repair protein RecF [endosymbiont of Galathealinum brachiosum]
MGLSSLEIKHFRNLQSVLIEPDAGLNLIIGENAAGKTSLLESIFYLSYGRSFRNSQIRHLVSYESDFFRLICNLNDNSTRIGLERNLKEQTIRINRQTVSRISELSTLLPVLVLHPDSHQLISSGPENRRQFMDWGVFHVEHQFIDSWKSYKKALSQRNAALRMQQSDKLCSLWNMELIEHAKIIETHRLNYLGEIQKIITVLANDLFPEHCIEMAYKRGWPEDVEYENYLLANLARDKDKGFTQSGPHRADIKITIDGKSAQSSISRGQQKKLVTLLKIAQLSFFSKSSDRRCILLFDDLPAELDKENQNKIMSILSKLNIQLFITAIESNQIDCDYWGKHKVFHVEHGCVSEVFR